MATPLAQGLDSHGADLMNDPAYATNVEGRRKSAEEADTCRICRGEGTKEEPLFFPCKCSGSIKFVHQECLMEWLSHSHKKHCELCKTPFTFTKLYHPNMPRSLPFPVFVRYSAAHGLKTFLTWARLLLVGSVWLFWLPWSMRAVWRLLFWLGDGGWVIWQNDNPSHIVTAEALRTSKLGLRDMLNIRLQLSATLANLSKYPASVQPMESASLENFTAAVESVLSSGPSTALNSSADTQSVLELLKRFVLGLGNNGSGLHANYNTTTLQNLTLLHGANQRHPSLLSNVSFLNSLTPSSMVNKVVIDVLEGQIITLFVVVAFILVFLIREWVVQQQPGVNLGPGFAGDGGERQEGVNDNLHNANPQGEQIGGRVDNARELDESDQIDQDEGQVPRVPHPRVIARHRRRTQFPTLNDEPSGGTTTGLPAAPNRAHTTGAQYDFTEDDSMTQNGSTLPQRPSLPTRGKTSKAAEVQRIIQENVVMTEEEERLRRIETMKVLLDRTGGDFDEVLRLTDAENHPEEFGWITDMVNRLQDRNGSIFDSQSAFQPHGTLLNLPDDEYAEDRDKRPDIMVDDEKDDQNGSRLLQHRSSVVSIDAPNHELSNDVPGETPITPRSVEPSSSGPADDYLDNAGDTGRGSADMTVSLNTTHEVGQSFVPIPEVDAQNHLDDQEGFIDELNLVQEPAIQEFNNAPQGIVDRFLDWLWGEAGNEQGPDGHNDQGNEERIVQNLADEPPFIPVHVDHEVPQQEDVDPEVAAAAARAGLDPNEVEVVDDGEDFEGLLELIGMQGPLTALFQNAMFSAVLISATVGGGVWVPYIWGKLVLLLLGNPVTLFLRLPLRWFSNIADFAADFTICFTFSLFYWLDQLLRLLFAPAGMIFPVLRVLSYSSDIASFARSVAEDSLERLTKLFLTASFHISETDYPIFSILSHQALTDLKTKLASGVEILGYALYMLIVSPRHIPDILNDYTFGNVTHEILSLTTNIVQDATSQVLGLRRRESLTSPSELSNITPTIDTDLAYWGTGDRIIAVLAGYVFFSAVGAYYLERGRPVSTSEQGKKIEGVVTEIIQQAGGVLKVILIISIEMIVFPLYCGLLLDIALLPLFENATIVSRLRFSMDSPFTSAFVRWFVGTCYMFHFALFVSMCRKIMRSGVLYFIRDPDDPTFHPVRDVLERSVSTQLRKIAFSALVYGGLVIICLGGVVWGLSYTFEGVLPIHWSSNEPVLEFPVDLLFYNFLMPLAVKIFKPSDGLQTMYSWWFQRCARYLRLTHFLFGERKEDEEGHYPKYSLWALIQRLRGEIDHPNSSNSTRFDPRFVHDGKFVRAPASDQVRIPKGERVFLEVEEGSERNQSQSDQGANMHERDPELFTKVYIPPWFRFRIALFILFIWVFAATTGVGVTVVPLVFGRVVFAALIPDHLRMNDVYAFSIGLYILGGFAYGILNYRAAISRVYDVVIYPPPGSQGLQKVVSYFKRGLKIVYAFYAFGFLLPSLFAMLVEFYGVIPLHTYLNPSDDHVIHFVSDWTLGVLYVKMIGRLILWHTPSRPAEALRAIFQNGWTDPDVRIATRCFIFPATLAMCIALLAPLPFGWLANNTIFLGATNEVQRNVYRFAYPALCAAVAAGGVIWLLSSWIEKQRMAIRDEVYLMGERLHNFGDRKFRSRKEKNPS